MSFIVDEKLEEYAERHSTPPDPLLAELAEETRATMSAPQMLTGPIEGRFLELLVYAAGARRVLEIGTFTGYAALSMAAALPEGGPSTPATSSRSTRRSRGAISPGARTGTRSRSTSARRSRRSRSSRASSTSSSSTPTRRTTTTTTRRCCRD